MLLLRASLNARIGKTGLDAGYVAKLWASALAGAAVGWTVKLTFFPPNPILDARLRPPPLSS